MFKDSLPSELTIMGIEIGIEKKPIRNAKGEFSDVHEVIRINSDYSDDVAKRAFVHELIHSILYLSGVHNHLDIKVEESICDAIETGLTQHIRFHFED